MLPTDHPSGARHSRLSGQRAADFSAIRDRRSTEELDTMQDQARPTVSIIIKALNEERHMAAVIESALAALDGIDGEVILADAASTDRSIEIAKRYPIKIVQLDNIEDRSCGSGAQLGFQYSSGRYLCLIDADMRLHEGYVAAAIRFLDENPEVGGVGGLHYERNTSNIEFAQRAKRADPDRAAGYVTRLNGNGVYRRSAIETIGHLTDRNLHGGEELDLGARLQAASWKLARINHPAIDHYGHTGSAFRLLLRRMLTLNAFGTGELVRSAIGRPHFWFILRHDRNCLLCLLVAGWWLTLAIAILVECRSHILLALVALGLFPIVVMSVRWRSLRNGLYSVAAWNMFTIGFLPGLLRRRVSPTRWIDSSVVEPGPTPIKRPVSAARQERAARAAVSPQAFNRAAPARPQFN